MPHIFNYDFLLDTTSRAPISCFLLNNHELNYLRTRFSLASSGFNEITKAIIHLVENLTQIKKILVIMKLFQLHVCVEPSGVWWHLSF